MSMIKVLLLMCFFLSFNMLAIAQINQALKPTSYEEAYKLAYDLVHHNTDEALKVIKYIYNLKIPVKDDDIYFVNSIAALALRPIYREIEIGKNLSEKVVAIKSNDFQSNAILYSLALMEKNAEKAKKYAHNLIEADYRSYMEMMEPASHSSIPIVRNYTDSMINLYKDIYNFLLEQGDDVKAKKVILIVNEINKLKTNK